MAPIYTEALAAMKAERAALAQQIAHIDGAIASVETLIALTKGWTSGARGPRAAEGGPRATPDEARPRAPRPTKRGPARKTTAKATDTPPETVAPPPVTTPPPSTSHRPKQRRGADGMTPKQRDVLDAVRMIGPTDRAALAKHVGLNAAALDFHLKTLLKTGQVIQSGTGGARVLRVAPTSAASTPAATAPAFAPLDPPTLDAGVLRVVRLIPSTFEELARQLLPERTDDAELLLKRSLRRLTLKDQIADLGTKFVAV